jgi:hypothetical protein
MVGGRIVAIREEPDRLCVTVADKRYSRHEFCMVDVAKTSHRLRLGDSLWWQGGQCYWTPDGESPAWDVPIPKIGYSYGVA